MKKNKEYCIENNHYKFNNYSQIAIVWDTIEVRNCSIFNFRIKTKLKKKICSYGILTLFQKVQLEIFLANSQKIKFLELHEIWHVFMVEHNKLCFERTADLIKMQTSSLHILEVMTKMKKFHKFLLIFLNFCQFLPIFSSLLHE